MGVVLSVNEGESMDNQPTRFTTGHDGVQMGVVGDERIAETETDHEVMTVQLTASDGESSDHFDVAMASCLM